MSNEQQKTTVQIDLTNQKIEIEKEVINRTIVKYFAPWFALTVTEAGQAKLNVMRDKGESKKVRNWIASHMRPRFDKLPDGKEGEAFAESIQIFEKALWLEKLWVGDPSKNVNQAVLAGGAPSGT